ncbi:MAG: HAMP domain-containing protein [Planctomycetes bacterium]|nr:HAMP domain-containing protein [Planctomycetota bacterium]
MATAAPEDAEPVIAPRAAWRPRASLGWRLTLMLGALLLVVGLASAGLTAWRLRSMLMTEARSSVIRLAEVVRRGTRNSMLRSHGEDVLATIRDIATLEGIEHVRIFNKDGEIVHSANRSEVGTKVDMAAEACIQCHIGERTASEIREPRRWRTFDAPDGSRVLASTTEIRNEPSCWTADCHAHEQSQSLLGVVDVGVSLRDVDARVAQSATSAFVFGLLATLVVCTLVGVGVFRFVTRPLRRLVGGMHRVSRGDLDSHLPADRRDELGDAARSFNAMTAELRVARTELELWTQTLEQQVEQRTKQLQAAQAQVVRAEKLSSLGVLAAGVAHELNSPLTGILTFAHLLLQRNAKGSQEYEDLEVIISETNRCAAIIRQLLDMARDRAPQRKTQDIVSVLRRAVALVENQSIFHDVNIRTEFEPDLPLVSCDDSQMEQVFLNLLINAAEAMPGGGRLTIRARRLPAADTEADAAPERVELSFQDTGIGIPEEAIGRVFDPFFTLKEVGKGTGLGLSVSYGIIENHGGSFGVDSKLGQGATFTIVLPALRQETAAR